MEADAPAAGVPGLRSHLPSAPPFDWLKTGPAKEGSSVAAARFRDGLCLPSGTALAAADLARVVGVIRSLRK